MRVCAGIILYNPDIRRLKDNLNAIFNQVEEVILVDNASANEGEILSLIKQFSSLRYVRNDKNYGIAKALNQVLEYAVDNKYDAFITLDQDSVCSKKLVNKYIEKYNSRVGQITCLIKDRNGEDVSRFSGNKYVQEIDHCITSGCINNTRAIKNCGGYDEKLFIDGVDIDISCRIRRKGYKILMIDYVGLLHELGRGQDSNKHLSKLRVANHVPWRNYYTRRNLIYVAKKYYTGLDKYKLIIKQIFYGIGIIILEDEKKKRIKYNLLGIRDGLRMDLRGL